MTKIGRWNALTSLLLEKKRQKNLSENKRHSHKYFKQDNAFWFTGVKQEIAEKFLRISLVETPAQEPVIAIHTETTKRVLDQSTEELKWLKIADLVKHCAISQIVLESQESLMCFQKFLKLQF